MRMIKPLGRLYEQLRRLPGIGSKTAMRLAYYVVDMPEQQVRELAEALVNAKAGTHLCTSCYDFCDNELCGICQDAKREHQVICVVEQPQDVAAMERSHGYQGTYHVLHGVLSPLEGIGPDKLKIRELLLRLQNEDVEEIIIATNSHVEGEATATYLATLLKPLGIKVTRIAQGLPMGGDLEYADEITLARALEHRRDM